MSSQECVSHPWPPQAKTNPPPYSRDAEDRSATTSLERTKASLRPSLPAWNLCVLPCTVIESPWSHPRFRGNSFVDVEAAISITPPRSGGVFARPANNRTMFSATALPPFKKNRFNSGRDGFPHRRRRRRSSSVDTPIGCSGMIY